MLVEPAIPDELFELLRLAASRRSFPQLWQAEVHELCRSVSTERDHSVPSPYWVQIPKTISEKFKTRTDKPLRNLRRFGEKWRRIVYDLTGQSPPSVSDERIEAVRTALADISRAFEQIRHSENCDHRAGCHRSFGCRHSIPNANYIIKKAFLCAYNGDRRNPEYQAIKLWFPQPQTRNRHNIRDNWWKPIVARLGLPYWSTKRPL